MTAGEPCICRSRGRVRVGSYHFFDSLRGGPRIHKGRGVHEIVGDDAESHPASDAIGAMVPTASQTMPSLEHADAAFAANAPALAAPKPALPLMRAPRRRFPTWSRQDHP